jgi:hypothetical protein
LRAQLPTTRQQRLLHGRIELVQHPAIPWRIPVGEDGLAVGPPSKVTNLRHDRGQRQARSTGDGPDSQKAAFAVRDQLAVGRYRAHWITVADRPELLCRCDPSESPGFDRFAAPSSESGRSSCQQDCRRKEGSAAQGDIHTMAMIPFLGATTATGATI